MKVKKYSPILRVIDFKTIRELDGKGGRIGNFD